MPGSNDLEFSLGFNLGPLQQAGMAVSKWSDETVKVMNRKFSAADLFKGVLQGVGIASVEQIAEKLVAPFKESAESAQKIAEWTGRAADATERLLKSRQSDAQQLAQMEKSAKRIANELNDVASKPATQSFFGWLLKGSAFDRVFGLSRKEEQAKQEKIAQKSAELQEKSLEIAAKKKEIDDKAFDQEIKNQLLRAEYVKQNREQLELEAKLIAGNILPSERARLDVLQLQNREREIDQRIQSILEKMPAERTAAERETLSALTRQKGALDQQIDAKQKIIEATKQQATAEAQVGAVIESNVAKWEEFVGVINSVGRGDSSLSDRELQRKIDSLNEQIFASQLQDQRGGYDWRGMNYNALGEASKGYLGQALAEQRLREETRRNIAIFGADRAFAMSGLSEQRFADVQRTARDTSEQTALLRRIADRFDKGVPTVPLTKGGT